MQNYHLIRVKYHSKRDGSSEVKLRSDRLNQTVFLTYDYEIDNIVDQAINWLYRNGHNVVGKGELKDEHILCVEPINNTVKLLKPRNESKH